MLRRRKLQQRIARAAFLEGAGALQIIELAMDVRAGELRQRNRLDAWRFVDAAAYALARGFDVGDRKHVSPAGPSQGTDPRPLGGQREQDRRPQDSRRLVPRSGMRLCRTMRAWGPSS